MKILTNHPGQESSPSWDAITTYVPPKGKGLVASLLHALQMYRMRTQFDCVVLGAGRCDTFFALLQSLLPFKKVPSVMIDCFWCEFQNKPRQVLNIILRKVVARSVDRFVVWARHEAEAFSRTFGIPREKFVFVPYHTTDVEQYEHAAGNGGYIFSGGNSERSYRALIEAIRPLPVRLFIATTNHVTGEDPLPENVVIRSYTPAQYRQKMANCSINVVALTPYSLRSAGQQTFLNSMLLKKPTIVTDPKGAVDYINNYEDGVIVPPNDAQALRKAIVTLLRDPDKAKRIGEQAAIKAAQHSTEAHFKKIIEVAQEVMSL